MKYCEDCKWFKEGMIIERCMNEQSTVEIDGSPVRKKITMDGASCVYERSKLGNCGPEGKNWEGRRP